MHLTALLIALIAGVAIIVLGARFILQPRQATLDFGIAADDLRGLTEIKGARDIASGVVLLVAWAAAGPTALGWVLVAAAITPDRRCTDRPHQRREAREGSGCSRPHRDAARRCRPRPRA